MTRRPRARHWLAIVLLLLGVTAALSRLTTEGPSAGGHWPMVLGVTLLDAERGTPIRGVRAVALRDGEPATWLELPAGGESDPHGKLVLQSPTCCSSTASRGASGGSSLSGRWAPHMKYASSTPTTSPGPSPSAGSDVATGRRSSTSRATGAAPMCS